MNNTVKKPVQVKQIEQANIAHIKARQIYDSRGVPTIETDVILENGIQGRACVPSGASTGSHEALELRDGGKAFKGKGVTQALNHIHNTIAPALQGLNVLDQRGIDQYLISLDGTPNKSHLGANTLLSVSLASAYAGANFLGLPLYRYLGGGMCHVLPTPFVNVINGGVHSNAGLSIQEFMLVPIKFQRFSQALQAVNQVFFTLKDILLSQNYSVSVGDEGGFAPSIPNSDTAIQLLIQSIEKCGYKPGQDMGIALDFAANEYYKDGTYHIDGSVLKPDDYISYIKQMVNRYPIVSIEDPVAEDDFNVWSKLTHILKDTCQIVGDDLFVTQVNRLQHGIEQGMGNAILIKVNQVGTLSEAYDAVNLAKRNNYGVMISHRSGETEDTTIADLAVATESRQIKTGSLSRSERVAKYNRLLRIEEELGSCATYGALSYLKK